MDHYDVMIYDDVGMRFNDVIVEHQALGGSEFVLWMLAREMGRRGLRVLVWQGACVPSGEESFGNVNYRYGLGSCPVYARCIIHHRYSSQAYESATRWDRRWLLCSDFWGEHYDSTLKSLDASLESVICISRWQAALFPAIRPTHVIQNPIPEESYAPVLTPRDQNVFLYASAALKGLGATLESWQSIRKKHPEIQDARLRVLSPGYDDPSMAAAFDGVELVGAVPFTKVLEELRQAVGECDIGD